MSLLKGIIKGLAEKGVIEHEVLIDDSVFVLQTIATEEQVLLETLSSTNRWKEKYDADAEINTYADTIRKIRDVTLLAFCIKSVDGHVVVDKTKSHPDQLKERLAFRDELFSLNPNMIDKLLNGYNELQKKSKEFYSDVKENLGK